MTIRELMDILPYRVVELALSSEACANKFLVKRDDFEYFYNLSVRRFTFENTRLDVELVEEPSKLWVYPLLAGLSYGGNVKVLKGENIDIIRKDELLDGLKVLPPGEIGKVIYSEPGDYIILVYNKSE